MSITIYGASDDLIEVEGDVYEEFNYYPKDEDSGRYLAISDGTLLRIYYDSDGIWRIALLVRGSLKYTHTQGSVSEDTNDIVTLTGQVHWVALAKDYALCR